jgi:hypothetical protein
MGQQKINLIREAPFLSGQERARLVIKDAHEKTFGDRKGFLNEAEVKALRRMTDYKVSEEYNKYVDAYQKTPVLMGAITEAYLRFKYFYENLQKAHILLTLSPIINSLTDIIKTKLTGSDEDKAEALGLADLIQTLKLSEDGKRTIKDSLDFVKETVSNVHGQACYFVSMKRIVDRLNEELGFDVFTGKTFGQAFRSYAVEIVSAIKDHNSIMQAKAGEVENINDYLISPPDHKNEIYEEWTLIVFKEKAKDV